MKGIDKTIALKRFGEYLSHRSVIIAKRDLDRHLRYVTRLNGISPRMESPLSISLIKRSSRYTCNVFYFYRNIMYMYINPAILSSEKKPG